MYNFTGPRNIWSSQVLHTFINIYYCQPLNFPNLEKCEALSHCALFNNSPMTNHVCIFSCLIDHFYTFFYLLKPFSHFLLMFFFLLLIFRSSLYVIHESPLSDVCIVNVSQLLGFFFFFFGKVSFDKENVLILIK